MRLLFFGSGAFGLPTLERLARGHSILAVVTQPDRPAGRGGKTAPTPIGAWAETNLPNAPIFRAEKFNAPEIVAQLRAFDTDAWVVIAFGQKLSKELLADRFAINLHASLLPRWRGAAPINAAILGGDTITGNSVITLADRMDAGLILGTSARVIDPLTTAGELHDQLSADGPDLVARILDQHARGTLKPVAQDDSQVTIANKLSKGDNDIDFHQPADFLRREIHALTPWPGITVQLQTAPPVPLKLLRAQTIPEVAPTDAQPGTLTEPKRGLIRCGNNTILQLLDVQPPGKKPMPWSAFANGHKILPNTMIVSARELA